jgi:hypothetical protein
MRSWVSSMASGRSRTRSGACGCCARSRRSRRPRRRRRPCCVIGAPGVAPATSAPAAQVLQPPTVRQAARRGMGPRGGDESDRGNAGPRRSVLVEVADVVRGGQAAAVRGGPTCDLPPRSLVKAPSRPGGFCVGARSPAQLAELGIQFSRAGRFVSASPWACRLVLRYGCCVSTCVRDVLMPTEVCSRVWLKPASDDRTRSRHARHRARM